MLVIQETVATKTVITAAGDREASMIHGINNLDPNVFRWQRVDDARKLNRLTKLGAMVYIPFGTNIEELINDIQV